MCLWYAESVSYANFKHEPPSPDNTNANFKQPDKAKLLEKEITVRVTVMMHIEHTVVTCLSWLQG